MAEDILVILLLAFILLAGHFFATLPDIPPYEVFNDERFVFTEQIFRIDGGHKLKVVKDTELGVLYLWDSSSDRGGLTPWLDADGNPIKDIEEETP